MGLDHWYGDRITCICAKDSEGDRFYDHICNDYDFDELQLIDSFLEWVFKESHEGFKFITYNGKSFDIPFILTRSSLLNPAFDKTRRETLLFPPHVDVCRKIEKLTGKRLSLDTVAKLLGCKSKTGNGKDAIQLWHDGKFKELMEYCMNDVEVTEDVYLKWKKLQGDVQ